MYTLNFNEPIHVYFMGIGGISMSGLAEILLGKGFPVSGSDMKESALTKQLEAKGVKVYYGQISEKANNIYLYIHNDEIVGSVACYGNEVDDLIVNKKYQNNGYGKQLLLWGMQHIRENNNEPITLHVAKWNNDALMLYKKVGFEITNEVLV